MVCAGVIVSGGHVRRSILSPGVRVHSYAEVDSLGAAARRRRRPRTPSCATRSSTRTCGSREGAQIGVDPKADRERFTVSARRHRRDRQGREGRGALKVALLTREYPPEVYGGAGVHVEYLARELARLDRADGALLGRRARSRRRAARRCAPTGPGTRSRAAARTRRRCEAVSIDLAMAAGVEGAALVHSHTWYANLAGHLGEAAVRHPARRDRAQPRADAAVEGGAARRRLRRLELLRAHRARGRRRDHRRLARAGARRPRRAIRRSIPARVSVIYNGIDTEQYRPDPATDVARAPRHRPGAPVGRLRRPDHAPEGRHLPARRGAAVRSGAPSSCSAPARPTRPRSPPRSRPRSSACAASAATSSGSRRCSRAPT